MRMILLTAVAGLSLVACQKQAEAPPADANAVADTVATDNGAIGNTATVMPATYEYTKDGKNDVLSIDANGNYMVEADGKHADHGTATWKDGKLCFTTAMPENKAGDGCWTDPKIDVAQSGETVSDTGAKLTLKRVEYKPLKM